MVPLLSSQKMLVTEARAILLPAEFPPSLPPFPPAFSIFCWTLFPVLLSWLTYNISPLWSQRDVPVQEETHLAVWDGGRFRHQQRARKHGAVGGIRGLSEELVSDLLVPHNHAINFAFR